MSGERFRFGKGVAVVDDGVVNDAAALAEG